jgi:ribosomal protein S18 acetylase RimI-like enzyme
VSDIDILAISSPTDPHFSEVYRIYRESIPDREQKSRPAMERLVASSQYRTWAAIDHGQVVGMAVFFAPAGESFALLEYMAVDPRYRNRGVGGILFRSTLDSLRRRRPETVLILEVDSDLDTSAQDREIRRRRKSFYRRLGCRVIKGCDYLLPLPGKGEPPRMELMAHPTARESPIPRRELEQWLRSIYRDVYSCSENDPRIARMLQTVADPIALEETTDE